MCFSLQVAALRFSGWAQDEDYLKQARRLFEALEEDGVDVVYSPYYTVGYDSPSVIENRRNEVWAVVKK